MKANFRKKFILYVLFSVAVINIAILAIIAYNFEPKIIKFILNFIGQHLGWWFCRFVLGLLILQKNSDFLIHSIFYSTSFLMIFILGYIRVLSEWGASRIVFGFCNSGVWLLSERSIKLKISRERQPRFFSLFLSVYHIGTLIVQNFMDRGFYNINYLHKPYQFSGGMIACFSCYALLPRIIYWGDCEGSGVKSTVSYKNTKASNFITRPFKLLWMNILTETKKWSIGNLRGIFKKNLVIKRKKISYIRVIKNLFHYKQISLFLVGICSVLPFITCQYINVDHLSYKFYLSLLLVILGMFSAYIFKFLDFKINILQKITPISRFRLNLIFLSILSLCYSGYIIQIREYSAPYINILILWILGIIGYTFYPNLVIGIQYISHNKTYRDLIIMMDISLLLSNSLGFIWIALYKFIYLTKNNQQKLCQDQINIITTYNDFFSSFLNCYSFLIFFSILPEAVWVYLVGLKKSLNEWINTNKVKAKDKLFLKLNG